MKTCKTITCIMLIVAGAVLPGFVTAETLTVKVGLLAPMSGSNNPDWGKKQSVGMQMAVEALNRRGGIGGIPIEALVRDTAGDPQKALDLYRELTLEEGALVVIGPFFSGECQSVFPATNDIKTAVIATASAKPGLSDLAQQPYAFRMTVTSDKKEHPAVKAWALAHNIKKVVILHDEQTPVTRTVAASIWPPILRGLNIAIANQAAPIAFKFGERDFSAHVKKAAAYQPDGICIAAMPMETGNLVKEIRRQGLEQPLFGASTATNPKVIEIAGEAAEGMWSVSLFYPEDLNPKVVKYVKAFRSRCAREYPAMDCVPEQYDIVVYDSLHFLADIMKKRLITGKPERLTAERTKIRDGLANMGVWRGTTGMMAFDKKGDGIRTAHVLRVQAGRWQPVR